MGMRNKKNTNNDDDAEEQLEASETVQAILHAKEVVRLSRELLSITEQMG